MVALWVNKSTITCTRIQWHYDKWSSVLPRHPTRGSKVFLLPSSSFEASERAHVEHLVHVRRRAWPIYEALSSSGSWLSGGVTCNWAISPATEVGSPVSMSSSSGVTAVASSEASWGMSPMSTSIVRSASWVLAMGMGGPVASTPVGPLSCTPSTITSPSSSVLESDWPRSTWWASSSLIWLSSRWSSLSFIEVSTFLRAVRSMPILSSVSLQSFLSAAASIPWDSSSSCLRSLACRRRLLLSEDLNLSFALSCVSQFSCTTQVATSSKQRLLVPGARR